MSNMVACYELKRFVKSLANTTAIVETYTILKSSAAIRFLNEAIDTVVQCR